MFYTLKKISNRNENVYKCDYVLPVFDKWVNVKLQSLFLEAVGLIKTEDKNVQKSIL